MRRKARTSLPFARLARFGRFGLAPPRPFKALLASSLLHGLLIAGILLLKPAGESSTMTTPGVLHVALVPYADGTEIGARDRELDDTGDVQPTLADSVAQRDAEVSPEAQPEAQAVTRPAARPEAQAATRPEARPEAQPAAPPEAAADSVSPAPADSEADREPESAAARTGEQAVADESVEPPRRPATDPFELATVAAIAIPATDDGTLPFSAAAAGTVPAARPATAEGTATAIELIVPDVGLATLVPEIETVDITDGERLRLTAEVENWARRFAELADWQPQADWEQRGESYRATVERLPAEDVMGIEQAIVTIETERNGQRFTTQMRMQRLAFSQFAQFIDYWDPNVQIHDDVIDGRFHSNSEILVDRAGGVQPLFTGKVTTARTVNTSRSSRTVRRSEVFVGGLGERVTRIPLPGAMAQFADDDAIDPERIHRFAEDTRIVFEADGSYRFTAIPAGERRRDAPVMPPGLAERRRLSDVPQYLVAGPDIILHVSGTVDGRVLVYSPEDIVIEGNLVYAADPAAGQVSDDYIGLVAGKRVEIAPPEVTGPGDISVQAAIYARRLFAVRDYSSSEWATLEIYGSLTAGSVTATEPRFRTEVRFDQRLAELRPPRFPMTDRYEIADWDGRWTVLADR